VCPGIAGADLRSNGDEIDLTDGNTKGRHVQPQGFVPSHLAEPALRDRDNQRTQLEYAATELGLLRAAADTIAAEGSGAGIADRAAAVTVSAGLLRVQRLLRALAAGALVALVAVGLSVGGARPAAAASVPVSAPVIEAPQPDPSPAKHSTRFGKGTWLDMCGGDLLVAAPLAELFPGYGWLASPNLPVQVQEWSVKRGRWVVRKVMLTNSRGIAASVVHIGGGIKKVRVVATETPWTLRATGLTRRVVVTTEPCDGV
jgi:hypothetical protein